MSSQSGAHRRTTLRHATNEAHARLDGAIASAELLNSRGRYEAYLKATWAARRPCEVALENSDVAELYPAWPRRRICHALMQDIVDVSHAPPAEAYAALTVPLTIGQSLGILYVLEGSALGARMLKSQVAAIGMTADFGARHMAAQTSEPRAWGAFLSLLERTELDTAEEELCAKAAVDAFARFEQAFQRLAVEA